MFNLIKHGGFNPIALVTLLCSLCTQNTGNNVSVTVERQFDCVLLCLSLKKCVPGDVSPVEHVCDPY